MGDYLRLNKRETLKEMTAEIEAMFFRFFSKHPEIDISNTSGNELVRKYWRVIEIDNSLIVSYWNDSELENIVEELKAIHHEMKEKGFDREGHFEVENLEEAVSLAKQICRQGHSVVLSPAASSYDHFKNFEERGRIFEELALHGS